MPDAFNGDDFCSYCLVIFEINENWNCIFMYLPGQFDLKVYPIIICLVGGLILGLIKSKYCESVYEMNVMLSDRKKEKNCEMKIYF